MSYDRYVKFRHNGKIDFVPNIVIPEKSSDYYDRYYRGMTRLDNLSYKYYGDANYDWLILAANPEYGSLEYLIPTGSLIRIPYPLDATLEIYNKMIDNYKILNK